MKPTFRFVILSTVTVVGGLFLMAQSSAVAESPAMLRQEFHDTIPDSINCGTFSVTFDLEERLLGIARFQNGVLVADSDHMHVTGTLINQTTLKTINTSSDYTFTFKPLNVQTIIGLFFKFSLPHGGTVTLDVGKFAVDSNGNVTLVGGQFDFAGDIQKICSALE